MAELQARDKVLVKNFKTGNVTTVLYHKAINKKYMKMCDLVAIDPRMTGEVAQAPQTSVELQIKKLQSEMNVEKVAGIEFVEAPQKQAELVSAAPKTRKPRTTKK